MTTPATGTNSSPSALAVVLLAALSWLGIVAARATAPNDLSTRDQERVGTYVLDIHENGSWLAQRDTWGNIASKPPLPNWIAAVPAFIEQRVTRFGLGVPGILASFVTLMALLLATARFAGRRAALWVAPLYLLSQLGLRQVFLVRSDPVFQCTIVLGSLALFRSWTTGRGWIWFWLAMAASALTKGPLGLGITAGGLLAAVFEWRRGTPCGLRGRIWPGALVFLAIPLGWFLLADRALDGAVYDKLIGDELVGHAVGKGERVPFERPLHPWAWFITRAAPVSLLSFWAIAQLVRRPSADDYTRRFERFLGCWILVLLVLLSIAGNKRFVHLLPILPPSAMLGARLIDRWLGAGRSTLRHAGVVCTIGVLGSAGYLHFGDHNTDLDKQRNIEALAERIETELGRDFPLHYDFDAPLALQVALDTFTPSRTHEELLEMLRGDDAVYVATLDLEVFRAELGERVFEVAWTDLITKGYRLSIVSNRPDLVWPESGGIQLAPEGRLEVVGGRVLRKTENRLEIRAEDPVVSWEWRIPNLRSTTRRTDLRNGDTLTGFLGPREPIGPSGSRSAYWAGLGTMLGLLAFWTRRRLRTAAA